MVYILLVMLLTNIMSVYILKNSVEKSQWFIFWLRRLCIQFPKTSDTLQMAVCEEIRNPTRLFWKV